MNTKNLRLKFLKWFVVTETTIMDNKHIILKHLFNSDFQELSIKESIELFKEVEAEFNRELSKRYIEAKIIIADIEQYNKEYLLQEQIIVVKNTPKEFLD
jgi:hypothetical protein